MFDDHLQKLQLKVPAIKCKSQLDGTVKAICLCKTSLVALPDIKLLAETTNLICEKRRERRKEKHSEIFRNTLTQTLPIRGQNGMLQYLHLVLP